jgi:hypothetical protein
LKEGILACLKVASGAMTMVMNGMCPLRLWQIGFRYPVPYASGQTFNRYHCLHLVLEGGVAEDFAVADGDKIKRKEVMKDAIWKRFR